MGYVQIVYCKNHFLFVCRMKYMDFGFPNWNTGCTKILSHIAVGYQQSTRSESIIDPHSYSLLTFAVPFVLLCKYAYFIVNKILAQIDFWSQTPNLCIEPLHQQCGIKVVKIYNIQWVDYDNKADLYSMTCQVIESFCCVGEIHDIGE